MKKLIMLVLSMFLLTACAAQVAQLQQLPAEGVDLIFVLVTTAVLWALLKLKDYFKLDLSGYAGAIAAVLAPLLVTWLESYLQLIPPIFDDLVTSVIHILVLLVGSLGSFVLFTRIRTKDIKGIVS